jgi:hypothetical protein
MKPQGGPCSFLLANALRLRSIVPATVAGESMAEDKKGRDWLAVGISVFSLGISALTAYRTILFQRDDVRVEVGEALRVMRDKNQFTLEEMQELTFINSGNRQAAVTGVSGMQCGRPVQAKASSSQVHLSGSKPACAETG